MVVITIIHKFVQFFCFVTKKIMVYIVSGGMSLVREMIKLTIMDIPVLSIANAQRNISLHT